MDCDTLSGTFGAIPTRGSFNGSNSEASFEKSRSSNGSASQAPVAETPTPVVLDDSSSVNDFLFTFDFQSGNIWGFVCLLLSFFCGTLGFHYIVVVGLAWCVTVYCFRRAQRRHRHVLFNMKTAMQDPDVARRIMGPYLPSWISFASVEKSAWLQDLVTNLWPNIAAATRDNIISSVDPILESYRPAMLLSSLCIGNCTLGTIPPVIDGIQTHRGEKDTSIDIYFHWNGNPDIRVVAKAMGVEVEVCICNLQVQSVIRVFLGPHCNAWPCFGCFSMCFVGKPMIDFSLRAAKIPLEAIPGLAAWLDGFIRYMLSWSLVYPKRLVIPMFNDMKDMKLMESTVDPIGRLSIRILRAERIPSGLFQTRRTYVEGRRTNGDPTSSVTKKTKSTQGKNPVYNEELVFTVYNAPNERIELAVYTDEPKPPVIGKMLMSDNIVGVHIVSIASLLNTELQLHSKCRLVNPAKTSIDVGDLYFESQFTPFLQHADLLGDDESNAGDDALQPSGGYSDAELTSDASALISEPSSPSALRRGRSSTTLSQSRSSAVPDEGQFAEGRSRRSASMGRLRRMVASGSSIRGILIVNIVSCSNLAKIDVIGSADPYVKLRLGTCMERTDHINDTLNPTFDIQKQMDVTDIIRDVLYVEVHDYDKIKINKRLLGKVSISVRDVFEAGCAVPAKPYALDPKGTITLGLKLLIQGS